MALVQRYETTDSDLRLYCHPVVHAIGRETFRLKGTIHDSFAACDMTCHSGCYHGAIERFLRGDAADADAFGHISEWELTSKVAMACDPRLPARFRFQCLHGLGHAIMFFSDYHLRKALEICDTLADSWSRSSCYGGVFMENLFSATPEKRDLSPTDYHYPCNQLDPKYRSDCYIIQTWRMAEMGLSTERLFEECRKAGLYRVPCVQSIGRDLSNDVRTKDPRRPARTCELVKDEDRRACIRGVVYALIDNTWDGRYAFPFCTEFRAAGDVQYCFMLSASYLNATFEKSPQEIRGECAKHLSHPQPCLDSVAMFFRIRLQPRN